jgi:hypothetical protein
MIATPKEPLAPNRIEPKAKERFAELHGLGATVREAATAMGFSVTTGEELMRKPEYRYVRSVPAGCRGSSDRNDRVPAPTCGCRIPGTSATSHRANPLRYGEK